MTLFNLVLVAFGGAIGATLRYCVTVLFSGPLLSPHIGLKLPLATLCVNSLGSFLFGFLYIVIVEKGLLAAEFRPFLLVGLLGAFTTFSTFSFESLALAKDGLYVWAGLNMLANVFVCLIAVVLGVKLAQIIV